MSKEKLYKEFLEEQMGYGDLADYTSVRQFKKEDPTSYEIGLEEFNT